MFIAALFTIAKTWKQPKCPLTDKWIKKVCIYPVESCSAIKNETMPFTAAWIQLEIIMLNQKDKYHVISLTCQIYNTTQTNLSAKQKQTHRHREQTCGCQAGRGEGEGWPGSLGLVDANYYI